MRKRLGDCDEERERERGGERNKEEKNDSEGKELPQ